jgi:outer membrane protein assembly factor BamB
LPSGSVAFFTGEKSSCGCDVTQILERVEKGDGKAASLYPEGIIENSPCFQAWDRVVASPSPEGTAEWSNFQRQFNRPFGTQVRPLSDPKVETWLKPWAIVISPFGTQPHSQMHVDNRRPLAVTPSRLIVRISPQILLAVWFAFWWVYCCRASDLTSEDWPQFLGPHQNGVSDATGLLDRWPTNGVPVVWDKSIGAGYSAPSVRGNRLVLHHRVGGEEIVECFEGATGKTLWRHGYPSHFTDPYGYNNGPRATPLLTEDRCYAFGAEGRLLCLDLSAGKLLWQRDTSKDWDVPPAFFGAGSSPVLEGDFVLVMVGGQPNAGMVAFDSQTGRTVWESVGEKNWQGVPMTGWPGEPKVQWKRWDKQASYSTPVAATVHGRRNVFCLTRQGLVSLNPTNGDVNFSSWFRSRLEDSVNAMSPVVVDDLVFISAAYYKIGSVLLRVDPDDRGFQEVWRSAVLETHWNTPIYHDGYLYAFSGRNEPDAHFRCVELKTGRLMWDRDESWPAHGGHATPQPGVYGRGSAILAEAKLIVLGEGGLLGLFKINAQKPEEISRWQVPQLHYACWAAPVLSRKKLYLRSEDRLVCLNVAR